MMDVEVLTMTPEQILCFAQIVFEGLKLPFPVVHMSNIPQDASVSFSA